MAKDELGESKGCGWLTKESWWWNKEIQATIRLKRESSKSLLRCRNNSAYKAEKREAKKVVHELYGKLETNDAEKNIYKLAKIREMKTRDLNGVKYVKVKD